MSNLGSHQRNSNDIVDSDEIYQVKGVFEHPNYFKVEKNVHVIKNFTTQEERDFFVGIAEAADEEDWFKDKREWWSGKILYVGDENLSSVHIRNIFARIKDVFNDSGEERWHFGGLMSVHRMRVGEEMFPHADNPAGTGDKTNYVQFGMTLYHSDFVGGEIHYDNIGVTYKPEKGDLLMHPGSTRYTHRTLPVKPGPIRYISTTFAYDHAVKKLRDNNMVFENMRTGEQETLDPLFEFQKRNNPK